MVYDKAMWEKLCMIKFWGAKWCVWVSRWGWGGGTGGMG